MQHRPISSRPLAAGLAALVALAVLFASLVGFAAAATGTGERRVSPAACGPGQAPRGATPDDALCVASLSRDRVAIENRLAASRRAAERGAATAGCRDGFVPREAVPGDAVCVTPGARAGVRLENRLHAGIARVPTAP